MPCARGFTLSAVLSATLVIPHPLVAATLPTGFTESVVANGLQNPTAMAFAPDGRLFVCGGWITFHGCRRNGADHRCAIATSAGQVRVFVQVVV